MSKRDDGRIDVVNEAHKVAKAEYDRQLEQMKEDVEAVRIESQAAGVLQTLQATAAYGELLKAITLHRIKESKEYKKGGMTWDGFCESQGLERRTVDRMLDDLSPIIDAFSDSVVRFSGMPFNKIRLLGRQISGQLSEIKDNCLVYGDETIPLTPEYRDDVQALIERIGEEAKATKEEAEANVRAKDKVLKSKEDVIRKQEKELARYEKTVKAKGLTPEEDSLLGKIDELGVVLNGHCLQLETILDALREQAIQSEPYPNAIAAFISLLDNVRMRVGAYRESVVAELSPPGMLPDEEWQPPVKG